MEASAAASVTPSPYKDGDYKVPRRFAKAVLVIGESGAGKSTWIKYLTGSRVPIGDGTKPITKACGMYECPALQAMMIDTRGYDDPETTNEQLTLDMLRFIRDNELQICLVMIFVTRTMRESLFINGMVNWTAGLHPDMRSRLHFWVNSSMVSEVQARSLVNPPIPASKRSFNNGYTFPKAEIQALLKEPLPAVWKIDKCTKCPLEGDRRLLADKDCLRHVKGGHNIQFHAGTSTTRAYHSGQRQHRGHFQGWFYGDTYAGCKCNHRLDGCTCSDCGRPWLSPPCRTDVTSTPGERYCTRCTTPNAEYCPTYCSECGSTANPPHTALKGETHEWVTKP